MQIGRQINKISNHLRRRTQRIQKNLGLSGSQAFVLDYIMVESLNKSIYQKDIEKEFGMRASSATELIHIMESKGLISRKPDERDSRFKKIELTKAADEIKRALKDEILETESVLIQNIQKEDLEIFLKVTNQMLENLEGLNGK